MYYSVSKMKYYRSCVIENIAKILKIHQTASRISETGMKAGLQLNPNL
jgi:hypothetical protein